MKEIVFPYLAAHIIGSGLLNDVFTGNQYESEKRYVCKLLRALKDVDTVAQRSREVLVQAINHELDRWAAITRYKPQIANKIKQILDFTISTVCLMHSDDPGFLNIIRHNHGIALSDISAEEFAELQEKIDKYYPGLTMVLNTL